MVQWYWLGHPIWDFHVAGSTPSHDTAWLFLREVSKKVSKDIYTVQRIMHHNVNVFGR